MSPLHDADTDRTSRREAILAGQRPLFRQVALDRLASPERLDELMVVTPARSWLALAAVWMVLLAALVWSVHGSVPSLLHGRGILIREGGAHTVGSPAAGDLRELSVNVGDDVRAEQVVARVFQVAENRTLIVTSPRAGRVREVRIRRGDQVQVATPLLILEQPGGPLEAMLYLSPTDAKKVQPGMEVQVAPASVRTDEHGLLLGRVVEVGAYPASRAVMRSTLGSDEMAQAIAGEDPVVEVRVQLARNPATLSGYQWTSTLSSVGLVTAALLPEALRPHVPHGASPPGPPIALLSGTPCTADVIVEHQAPIRLVLARFGR